MNSNRERLLFRKNIPSTVDRVAREGLAAAVTDISTLETDVTNLQALIALLRGGAFVTKSATQTIATTTAFLSWDTEQYDDNGWHDNATNNTRLTVPVGISRVRVGAFIAFSNVDDGLVALATVAVNNSTASIFRAAGTAPKLVGSTQSPRISLTTGMIPVTPGDYFEISASVLSDASFDISNVSNFWIQAC